MILRQASSPRLAGGVVFEEGRGGGVYTIRRCFLARHELFSPPVVYISFARNGISRETISVPPLDCMNVTAVSKDLCCLVLTV